MENQQVATIANQISNDMLKAYLDIAAPGLHQNEQKAFFEIAKMYQLNPYKREIYAIPYGKGADRKISIITGYEVYLKRAERCGMLNGFEVSFSGELMKTPVKNKWGDESIGWTPKEGHHVFATATVWRKDREHPISWSVDFEEYYQTNQFWNSKPKHMLKKVALAQTFRLAFPDEFDGLPYIQEEVGEVIEQEKKKSPPAPDKDAAFLTAITAIELHPDQLTALLDEFKARNLQSIPPDQRREFHTQANALKAKTIREATK